MKKLTSTLAALFILSSLSFSTGTADASPPKHETGYGSVEVQSSPKHETGY